MNQTFKSTLVNCSNFKFSINSILKQYIYNKINRETNFDLVKNNSKDYKIL